MRVTLQVPDTMPAPGHVTSRIFGHDATLWGADAESEQRWAMQLEELYYRFYARAPTDAERAAVRKAFLVSMQHEGYPPSAWVIVLYALLASEEFWHV